MAGGHDLTGEIELGLEMGQASLGDVVVAAATHHHGIEHPRLGERGRAAEEIPGHDLLERQPGLLGKGPAFFVAHRVVRVPRLE